MDDEEVGGPLISTHILDVNSQSIINRPLGNSGLLCDLSSSNSLRNEIESATEANDVLKNGIFIETSKGLEWMSLTDALASGVGGLNLSVEDFQNVAAHLLSHKPNPTLDDPDLNSSTEDVPPSTSSEIENPLQCYELKLESIQECVEHNEDIEKIEVFPDIIVPKVRYVNLNSKSAPMKKKLAIFKSSDSSSFTVSESTGTNSDSSVQSVPLVPVKRKGGWPKGRKRKPEVTNRPPKAPCTGYVYYLNEKRKRPEFRNVPFPEVTKILGNEWSSLSQENRKEYLEKAEIDKKRYREELKIYRNSDTYRSYLKRRRIKTCKNDGTEESDFDATDDIDDEDNEELYCRACDQWFTTLHNKKEHLYGKQHFQAISQNISGSCSLDESSMDGSSLPSLRLMVNSELPSVPDAMTNVLSHIAEREREIKTLQEKLKVSVMKNKQILKELQELKQSQVRLRKLASRQDEEQTKIKKCIGDLYDIPTLFMTVSELLSRNN